MRALRRLILVPLAILAVVAPSAAAKPPHAGSLDVSFGDRGRVLFNLPGERMRPRAALVQPDGKVVVAGYLTDSPTLYDPGAAYGRALAVRFRADGTLDTSFADGGVARVPLRLPVRIAAVAIQPDGSLLLAGTAYDEPGRDLGAVVRLRPDGAVDESFGTGGLATVEGENVMTLAPVYAVTQLGVHPDGRILVAGYQRAYDVHDQVDPFMARLLPNGAPDPAFDENGTARAGPESPMAIVPQPDGDLVVLGTNQSYFGEGSFTAHRVAQQPAPNVSRAYEWKRGVTGVAAQVQPDGGVLVTGGITGQRRHFLAQVRIGPELELLERAKTPAPDLVRAGTFDPRGALIATPETSPYESFALRRFRGRRFHQDRSFGARDGVALLDIGDPGELIGMTMQAADKLIVAGYTRLSDSAEDEPLTLFRLHARQDAAPPALRLAGLPPRACLDAGDRVVVRARDESRFLVRVSLDGRPVKKTRNRGVTVPLHPEKLDTGRHRLTVTATDAAGNRSRRERSFRVCA